MNKTIRHTFLFIMMMVCMAAAAQDDGKTTGASKDINAPIVILPEDFADSTSAATTSSFGVMSLATDSMLTAFADSSKIKLKMKRPKRDWSTWRPNAKRAMWLAIVLPGAGQIYNRKYWKLPLVYGGFMGCLYALTWNNQMYKDYTQAYLDIMDDDPNTQSYNDFLHLGMKITPENRERYQNVFKRRKDYYRRYRDMSFFFLIGVYALSIVDAYVDASLSEFDISKDLSMKVSPAVIGTDKDRNPLKSSGVGVNCALTF